MTPFGVFLMLTAEKIRQNVAAVTSLRSFLFRDNFRKCHYGRLLECSAPYSRKSSVIFSWFEFD